MQDQESQNVPVPVEPVDAHTRQAALNAALSDNIRKGWRVESQTEYTAAIVKGKRPNHILHLILSLVTAGLWALFVWLPLCIFKHVDRRLLQVDANGRVTG
jgi:hypothetical protein